jgi:hypothetical protein
MWYYRLDKKDCGPTSIENLRELAITGQINEKTPVVKVGLRNWKWLRDSEISEYVLSESNRSFVDESNISDDQSQSISKTTKVKLYNLNLLFIIWVLLAIIDFTVHALAVLMPKTMISQNQLKCLNGFFLLEFIFELILLYRLWSLIPFNYRRTSPGKAVGFLLIPFFSFYWNFVAFWGFSKDLNLFITKMPKGGNGAQQRKIHPQLALIYSLFTAIYSILLIIFLFIKMLIDNSQSWSTLILNGLTVKQLSLPVSFLYEINICLFFLMFLNFYLTAKNILEAEENH